MLAMAAQAKSTYGLILSETLKNSLCPLVARKAGARLLELLSSVNQYGFWAGDPHVTRWTF